VFFSSDNGAEGGGDMKKLITFFDGTGGLRGSKGFWYEGGIRDPLIVRWPAHIKPGTVSDHLCAFWDFFPTFAEIAGVPSSRLPKNLDGISIVPTLRGQLQRKHDFLYWEMPVANGGTTQAIRLDNWKAVKSRPSAAFELYNLVNDPKETTDVAEKNPDVMKKIAELAVAQHTPERDYPDEEYRPGIKDYVK
ncbi:MAG: sulfatase/phosphatase domain-containing protein, partial [Opitutaceae bacterium]